MTPRLGSTPGCRPQVRPAAALARRTPLSIKGHPAATSDVTDPSHHRLEDVLASKSLRDEMFQQRFM
jgi:hypothetical protein